MNLHHFGANSLVRTVSTLYNTGMESFRKYLKQEFIRRVDRNPHYSLRAYAKHLNVNHATLSSMLSGKRAITQASLSKFAKALNLSPKEVAQFNKSQNSSTQSQTKNYFLLQQEAFQAMSEWYFDAILELSRIPRFKLLPEIVADSIGITTTQAKSAIETLVELGLLKKTEPEYYELQHQDSTNLLDENFTSVANKKHQKSILEKSIESIDSIDREQRDHTSTTISMNSNDLSEVKKRIRNFRKQLDAYLQRKGSVPDEVFQLQVSFFPLSNNKNKGYMS